MGGRRAFIHFTNAISRDAVSLEDTTRSVIADVACAVCNIREKVWWQS